MRLEVFSGIKVRSLGVNEDRVPPAEPRRLGHLDLARVGLERDKQNTPLDLVRRNGIKHGGSGPKPKAQGTRKAVLHGRRQTQKAARTSKQQTRSEEHTYELQ